MGGQAKVTEGGVGGTDGRRDWNACRRRRRSFVDGTHTQRHTYTHTDTRPHTHTTHTDTRPHTHTTHTHTCTHTHTQIQHAHTHRHTHANTLPHTDGRAQVRAEANAFDCHRLTAIQRSHSWSSERVTVMHTHALPPASVKSLQLCAASTFPTPFATPSRTSSPDPSPPASLTPSPTPSIPPCLIP
eukprot:GHVU01046005.1.p2 GENE.GHVU01046005.1~~GHVU01046005.1.p2  ORF type:complete len:186 (+),score=3.65 GHVU01046005.1:430-987(+)